MLDEIMMNQENQTETMIAQENQTEAEMVMDFVESLNQHERKEFRAFLQGAKFVKKLMAGTAKIA